MDRMPKQTYLDKWKKLGKSSEKKYTIGKLYTIKESSAIKRLQANNIIGCVFKTSIVDQTVIQYFYFNILTLLLLRLNYS